MADSLQVVASMTDVGNVALWAGLIASIVGIVLSLVAIVFSVHVDRRSSRITDHTIQSLQKIESAVERLSSDTRELIKAGWDKMLGSVETTAPHPPSESNAKQVAAGIAAELRAELGLSRQAHEADVAHGGTKAENIDKILNDLQESVEAQLRAQRADVRPSAKLDRIIEQLTKLSPRAQALQRGISKYHLTLREYKKLQEGSLASELSELRRAGLLIPVVHRHVDGKEEPCYYMPPDASRLVRAALTVLPPPAKALQEEVAAELKQVGYASDLRERSGHDGEAAT